MAAGAPMHEVEAKLRLADPAAARATLLAAGARHMSTGIEADVFFHHPSRDLADRDEALRLRRTAKEQVLTFKGPRSGAGIKTRVELSLELAPGADPEPLLLALGFTVGPRVRKQRESYLLDGLTVTLDNVDGLGWYSEVEALVRDAEEGTQKVETLLQRLGWATWPRENRPYIEMVEAARGPRHA